MDGRPVAVFQDVASTLQSVEKEVVMKTTDPVRGRTIQWTFRDGPMQNKTYEHTFGEDGSVSFRSVEGDKKGKATRVEKYESATVSADVHAVSYLSESGFTLTVVLDFATRRLAAFASNEKQLSVQKGTFEVHADELSKPSHRAAS
jgi:hypothetical protein